MFKNILLLVVIAILAGIGAIAVFWIIKWVVATLLYFAVLIAAFLGILFLIRKLRSS